MSNINNGSSLPKRSKTKIALVVLVGFIATSILACFFWCLFQNPCFLRSEKECIEYGLEQDSLNPQVIELPFSFLLAPGTLVYPWISTYKKEEGSVVLHIEIDADGKIISNKISKSSGFERLDAAAVGSLTTFEVDLEKLNAKEFPVSKDIRFNFALR